LHEAPTVQSAPTALRVLRRPPTNALGFVLVTLGALAVLVALAAAVPVVLFVVTTPPDTDAALGFGVVLVPSALAAAAFLGGGLHSIARTRKLERVAGVLAASPDASLEVIARVARVDRSEARVLVDDGVKAGLWR
jgi:hypothetical protein